MLDERTKRCEDIAKSARRTLLDMYNYSVRTMHWGGSLSCIDILSVLHGDILNSSEEEGVFVLSKGHAAPGLYAVLYSIGKLSLDDISTYQHDGSMLSELIEYNKKLGFCASGGSLGNGVSYAVGVALLAKMKGVMKNVYVLAGDGETNEGIVWEAILTANKYKLDNLYMIVDCNGLQSDGEQDLIMPYNDLNGVYEAMGCEVITVDGNNCEKLLQQFDSFRIQGKPKVLLAKTIKGKGVSFMEGNNEWHDKKMTKMEYESALSEVNNNANHG